MLQIFCKGARALFSGTLLEKYVKVHNYLTERSNMEEFYVNGAEITCPCYGMRNHASHE